MAHDPNISPVGWYIASYILRSIELGRHQNSGPRQQFLTWENTILVKATNIDETYDKVVQFASEATGPYKAGPKGVDAQWLFEGVSELLPIYEELEDGSELMWGTCKRNLKTIQKFVKPRENFLRQVRVR